MAIMIDTLAVVSAVDAAEGTRALEHISASSLPVEAGVSFRKGLEWLSLGEAGEAGRWFEQALACAPEFADGHVGLGIAYSIEARVYPALDHLQTATRLEPANFYAHFKLGQLYFKLCIPQKGYEEMARALDCASSLEERRLVAQLLREEKQREKNAFRRPWWNKRFSPLALFLGAGLMAAMLLVLLAHLR